MKSINLIAAIDQNRGLGKNNDLVWSLPTDMKYFKKMTTDTSDPSKKNAVIMGRKTWQSIPPKYRPLPKRLNVILSKTLKNAPPETLLFRSIDSSIESLQKNQSIESIYIIGGASIYNQSLQELKIDNVYLTSIQKSYECDTYLDQLPKDYQMKSESELNSENDTNFTFQVFSKNQTPQSQSN